MQRKRAAQDKLRERYEKGDPEVDLLGEPTGKFEYYVLYSKRKAPVAETTTQTQTPPLGEDQVSIPFTESSSQNRNNPSEASSATPLPEPIVESPPGGYDAATEYSRSKVGEYREKCLVERS